MYNKITSKCTYVFFSPFHLQTLMTLVAIALATQDASGSERTTGNPIDWGKHVYYTSLHNFCLTCCVLLHFVSFYTSSLLTFKFSEVCNTRVAAACVLFFCLKRLKGGVKVGMLRMVLRIRTDKNQLVTTKYS